MNAQLVLSDGTKASHTVARRQQAAECAFQPLAILDDRLIVARMGDKSPKSKQRDQKQKDAAKATNTAQAKAKQDSYGRPAGFAPKGRG